MIQARGSNGSQGGQSIKECNATASEQGEKLMEIQYWQDLTYWISVRTKIPISVRL